MAIRSTQSAAPVAPIPMGGRASSPTANLQSYVVDPLQFGVANIGEGETFQTGFGELGGFTNLAPIPGLEQFAQRISHGEEDYTTRYNLPAVADYMSQQGMEFREAKLPGNRVARWVQGPQGTIEGTYQEVDYNDRDFGLASKALMAAGMFYGLSGLAGAAGTGAGSGAGSALAQGTGLAEGILGSTVAPASAGLAEGIMGAAAATAPSAAAVVPGVATAVPTAVGGAGTAAVPGAGVISGGTGLATVPGAGLTVAPGAGVISGGTGLTLPASMSSALSPATAAGRAGLTFGQQLALSAIPAIGSQIAARQQASGAREAARIAAEARAPYTRAAEQALSTLSSGIAPGGQFAQRYDFGTPRAAQLAAEDAARRNIEQSAASRGGLLTSNTLDQIQRESARIGAQYQNQDFNQWLAEQQLLMKPLETMVGMGSQQISQVADIGSTAALAAAGSRAGATMQTANLLTSGISRAMNQEDIMQRLQEILGMGGGPGRFSDERLKSDIRRVGSTDDGLPVYVYRMGDGPMEMGVMAQDVEAREPRAVATHSSGYKMVDYDRVS